MLTSKENLSVIIVNFMSDHVIHRCISSIDKEIEIIVVDNSTNKKFKNDIENKRILRLKNSLDEFDNIKKKIIDNYVADLIQKQEKDVDINKINDKIKLYDLKKDLVQIIASKRR